MKSILGTTALAALMMGAAVTTVQAGEVAGLWLNEGPLMLLAEGGSDRLMDYRLQREALVSSRPGQDSSQRFVQMIKQQPTAAGSAIEQRDRQTEKSEPSFRSPIWRDRAVYGSPH